MADSILFYSTNRGVAPVTLDQALLQGQAADRGLFLPDRIPTLSPDDLRELAGRPYAEVAYAVLRPFTTGVFEDELLRDLCADAYDYDVPLERVTAGRWLLRLDRGPTASFKDFAARMMARWMSRLVGRETGSAGGGAERAGGADGDVRADDGCTKRIFVLRDRAGEVRQAAGGDLIILTATSGDTGSAVAHAYYGVPRVRVVVLFPPAEVSDRQRKQMTTLGGNVTTIAVDGKFDDCQALVKQAFADPALRRMRLSSANSINIGRLLPQAVYYVYAYVNLTWGEGGGRGRPPHPDSAGRGRPPHPEIVVSVPSGNFGDMMGAVIARRMGVPIAKLVIATNANDEVPDYLRTGKYHKIAPSRVCISNAMNVGHPSNLARLVDLYGGWMDETGCERRPPDMEAMRRDLYAVSISDEQTRATIRRVYEQHGVLLEPHGAVGWAGLERFAVEHPEMADVPAVSVETAHPGKFPEEIRALLGVEPEVPPSLAGLEQKPEHSERMAADYGAFRAWLERFAG